MKMMNLVQIYRTDLTMEDFAPITVRLPNDMDTRNTPAAWLPYVRPLVREEMEELFEDFDPAGVVERAYSDGIMWAYDGLDWWARSVCCVDLSGPTPPTYEELPDEQKEWFDYLFSDLMTGSRYWMFNVRHDNGRWSFKELVAPNTGGVHTVTRDDVIAALAGDAGRWFRDHGRDYFGRFGRDMLDLNFARADYDADVTDCLVQLIVFGDVIYG